MTSGQVPADAGVGKRPLPSARKWQKVAETLAPDKVLERVYSNIKSILSTVSVVGVLLGGFGLVTATTLESNPWLLVGSVTTSMLSAVAVSIALWAMIVRQEGIAPDNLKEVEEWYLREMKRGKSAAASGWLLFAAGVVASLTALVAGIGVTIDAVDATPVNRVVVDTTVGEDGLDVHLGGDVTGIEDDETVHAVLMTGTSAQPGTVYVDVVAYPDSTGTVSFDSSASIPSGTELTGEVRVLRGADQVKTFPIDLSAAP